MVAPYIFSSGRAIAACTLLVFQCIIDPLPAYAESRVFKCTGSDGLVVFSQIGCEHGVGESIKVDNPEMGWINLEKVVRKFKATKADKVTDDERKRELSSARSEARTQLQSCWRAEKKVAQITRELKQGYRLAQGEKLRYQRKEQEEYLKLFCAKDRQ